MLDAATRAQVIEKCIAHLRDSYVFPEVGAAMHDAVRQRREKGEYDAIESPAVLAAKLTKDFQEVSRDKHLRVVHSNATPDNAGAADSGRQRLAHEGRNNNFGFARVDRLAGNVGYIDLRSFSPASLAADAAAMAMNAVADADALIIDVRQNGGGDGDMVALLISYLVDGELVHVNDFVGRDGSVLHESWTRKDVAGRRFGDIDALQAVEGHELRHPGLVHLAFELADHHLVADFDAAVEDAADRDPPQVVARIEVRDQHLQRRFGIALRRRNGLEN